MSCVLLTQLKMFHVSYSIDVGMNLYSLVKGEREKLIFKNCESCLLFQQPMESVTVHFLSFDVPKTTCVPQCTEKDRMH